MVVIKRSPPRKKQIQPRHFSHEGEAESDLESDSESGLHPDSATLSDSGSDSDCRPESDAASGSDLVPDWPQDSDSATALAFDSAPASPESASLPGSPVLLVLPASSD